MTEKITPVAVHVVNAHEMVPKVEEVEPEHFVTTTMVPGALNVAQILMLDPLRKEALISMLGTNNGSGIGAYVCHSNAQATKVAGGSTTDGAAMPAGTVLNPKGSAPLWIVVASGATISIGIIQFRRAK